MSWLAKNSDMLLCLKLTHITKVRHLIHTDLYHKYLLCLFIYVILHVKKLYIYISWEHKNNEAMHWNGSSITQKRNFVLITFELISHVTRSIIFRLVTSRLTSPVNTCCWKHHKRKWFREEPSNSRHTIMFSLAVWWEYFSGSHLL